MKTFAERLKEAITRRGISQAEAARKSGISQQSINYIISKNLNSSKLGVQIALAININPEWLIYGRGKFEDTKVYELPIIHSPYMLGKFLNDELEETVVDHTFINIQLGNQAFAYLLDPKQMLICHQGINIEDNGKFLTIDNAGASVTNKKGKKSFPIYEWRKRYVDF